MGLTVRGLWVVRTSITSQQKVERLVDLAVRHQINTLVVQVRGRGDAYYADGLEPRAESLAASPAEFDPLSAILHQAAGTGIRVHAWLNANYVWEGSARPAAPNHIVNLYPEWLMRHRTGEPAGAREEEVEGAYVCPSNLAARKHTAAVFLDIARRYPVDGVHMDYIRYASPDFCFCESCAFRFREYLRWWDPEGDAVTDADLADTPLSTLVELHPAEWDQFRRTQISDLVRIIYREVKAERENAIVSAAVFADAADAYHRRFQDWKSWLAGGTLDVVCPMAYTTDIAVFSLQIRDAVGATRGWRPVWAGIGAYRSDEASTEEKIEAAESVGASGVLLFSYGAITGEGERDDYLLNLPGLRQLDGEGAPAAV
jgi:uncharacterized lipoprotein YddW (UPF0748 family)